VDEPLTRLTLAEAAARIRSGALSPVDLVEACLARIDYLNPRLNAFLYVMAADARRQARYAEDAIRHGEVWGPLHGVPIGVKDLIDVAGAPTTGASDFLREAATAAVDAPLIERLRAAGGIVIGKTHLHEFALGATNVNPHYGPARNPWNLDLSPGGSSGGSAAAVAAELCPAALGSDTGGSIRVPSALCGLTGVRPALGTVNLERVIPVSWSLDTVGTMAHDARDAAMLLDAIDRRTGIDHTGALGRPVDGLRIGVPEDAFYWEDTAVAVVAAVHQAADRLAGLGMRLVEIKLPDSRAVWEATSVILLADAAAYHRERLETEPERFGADVRARLESALERSSVDYAQARQAGREWRRTLGALFEDEVDVILTPAAALAAHPIADSDNVRAARELLRLAYPFSLSHLPALVLPCGFTLDELPVGMQLVAPDAGTLFAVAHAYQRVTPWHTRRPLLDFDVEDLPASDGDKPDE
jgi:aspartyl-tRNA(Asn)/glutamyl-tRNA(Gln) amidotransferase subunit A